MQWSKLSKCGCFFQHSLPCGPHTSSIGVAALGYPWYRISPRKSPPTADLIMGPMLLHSQVFFHVGEQKIVRWYQIRRIWIVMNQFKATVMHISHCSHRLVCRSIVLVLVKLDSLCQFSRPFTECLLYYFQSPELLIHYGLLWKETMQLVSGKVEFNACQFSLVWHNSFFIVSLLLYLIKSIWYWPRLHLLEKKKCSFFIYLL